jgi:hypothetical protein
LWVPLEIVISLRWQLINASTVANQGQPSTTGCPSLEDFGCITKKSTVYSQEVRVTVTSSKLHVGLMTDLSTNSNRVWVGLKCFSWSICMVPTWITFIVAPRSISVFGNEMPLIYVVTIGFHGSLYLNGISYMNSDNCPTTCITRGSFLFLPGLLMQRSLTILTYIGMSLITCSNEIFTHIFLSSASRLCPKGNSSFFIRNLSR